MKFFYNSTKWLAYGLSLLLFLAYDCQQASAQVFAYVSNIISNDVSVVNTATNTVTATIPVGVGPFGVSVSPDGSKVYVANQYSNDVSVINTTTNMVIATIPVGTSPVAVAVSSDGSKVYVANQFSNNVSVINTATNMVTATILVGIQPAGVSVSPDGSKVYVANQGNDVSVIDTATNMVTATILVGTSPFGVSVSPDGSKVYVTNQASNNVWVIDTATNMVTATVTVGTSPVGVSVSPDGSKVYVANANSDNVSVINTATNMVTATVTVGLFPIGVSVSPDGSKVYVANQLSDNVSVINTATDIVTATVGVGVAPFAFGNMMIIVYPLWYRTTGAVTFTSATNWESSLDGTTWSAAASAPDGTTSTLAITIRNGHTATVDTDISLDQLTVETGGVLQVSTSITLTIADGTGIDIDIQGTGTLTGLGNFTLSSGATFRTANVNGFNAIGLTGTETFTAGANYEFNGTALQTINNPVGISANNFTINNSAGATLSNAIIISGILATTLGDLDLNGRNVDLGSTGILNEDRSNNHLVKDLTATSDANSGGGILFTATVTDTSNEIRGTGLYLQCLAGDSYAITVARKHYKGATPSQGGKGIARVYQITGDPSATVTTMRIYYASDEIVGAGNVADFVLFRWQSGVGWKRAADAGSNFSNGTNGVGYAEATDIASFSHWTVGSSVTPLPITLLGLKGERVEGLRGEITEEVRLEWSTASEINNKGFEVEMSEDGLAYTKIAFVEGKGNSSSVMSYELSVHNASNSYYRLKQIDFDGTFSYSPIVFVEGVVGKIVVYPNPNKGAFTISVGKDKLDSPARLLNAVGKEVWRGVQTEVRTTGLPTGVYFLHTTVAGKTNITKVIIM